MKKYAVLLLIVAVLLVAGWQIFLFLGSSSAAVPMYRASVFCTPAVYQAIRGAVFDPNDRLLSGVEISLGTGDQKKAGNVITGTDGRYAFIFSVQGTPRKFSGSFYVWVLDAEKKRISEIAGPITLSDSCQDAVVDFHS